MLGLPCERMNFTRSEEAAIGKLKPTGLKPNARDWLLHENLWALRTEILMPAFEFRSLSPNAKRDPRLNGGVGSGSVKGSEG